MAAWLLATGSGCGHALEDKDYDTEAVQRNVVVEGPEGSNTLEEVADFGSSYHSSYLSLSFPASADALDSEEWAGFRKVEVRDAPALGETIPIDYDPYFCERFSGTIRGITPDPSLFAEESVQREERHFDGHKAYAYEITCDELRVTGEVHMAIYYTWRTLAHHWRRALTVREACFGAAASVGPDGVEDERQGHAAPAGR